MGILFVNDLSFMTPFGRPCSEGKPVESEEDKQSMFEAVVQCLISPDIFFNHYDRSRRIVDLRPKFPSLPPFASCFSHQKMSSYRQRTTE